VGWVLINASDQTDLRAKLNAWTAFTFVPLAIVFNPNFVVRSDQKTERCVANAVAQLGFGDWASKRIWPSRPYCGHTGLGFQATTDEWNGNKFKVEICCNRFVVRRTARNW
jgi:hypothetical protein